jgi:hypothetical protein
MKHSHELDVNIKSHLFQAQFLLIQQQVSQADIAEQKYDM